MTAANKDNIFSYIYIYLPLFLNHLHYRVNLVIKVNVIDITEPINST